MNLPKDKKIILFDGVCNLCDRWVQYVIRRDRRDVFRFVSLQSELGREILAHIGVDPAKTDSIVLYEPGRAYYTKSGAILEIGRTLGGLLSIATVFRLLPNALPDPLYDYVAKNRYRWYGKKACEVPQGDWKGKFL